MSSKLKVQELRDSLSKRGLDTSGLKPALVARLDEAIASENTGSNIGTEKDEERSTTIPGSSEKKTENTTDKRKFWTNDQGDTEATSKRVKIEDVENMPVSELKSALSDLGCSVVGAKNALKKRLTYALSAQDSSAKPTADGVGDLEDEQNLVTATSKQVQIEDVANMPVSELKAALSDLGCSVAGGINALKKRLTDALRAQDSSAKPTADGVGDLEDEQNLVTATSKPVKIEDVENMPVSELKAALSDLGCSVAGAKNALKKRLTDALRAQDSSVNPTADVVGDLEDEQNLVTALKKGRAVLDQYLPDDIKSKFHVFEDQNGPYDAMLNQTNVGNNNNKFYVIQALEHDKGGVHMVYTRWGRVGVKGQSKMSTQYPNSQLSTQLFKSTFRSKTSNDWERRHDFQPRPGAYTLLEMDYGPEPKDEVAGTSDGIPKAPKAPSKLSVEVEKLISLICNISMMNQQMAELGYDARKMPLGKLSKTTISKGYDVLKRIAAVLDSADSKTLEHLSSEFYTVIPHNFGFAKMREFTINNPVLLKKKLEMVEALGEIELATKILANDDKENDDLPYFHYKRLNCALEPVPKDTEEAGWIQNYLSNTHGETHNFYTLTLQHVFKVVREGEDGLFEPFRSVKNRMLLWHGSRLCNWTGILSQGLRIAPPEAPVSGYMFGKGVYFADMVSKSANYCCTSSTDPVGLLLLCEVALGEMRELSHGDCNANKLPKGKLSTKGMGTVAPNEAEFKILPDGVIVPMGRPKQDGGVNYGLQYNEYIVYNTAQIQMRNSTE